LHTKPYDDARNQRLQVFNELVVYFCCYLSAVLLMVTSSDPIMAFQIGWFMISGVIFNIVFNMVLVFRDLLRTAKVQFLRKNREMIRWDYTNNNRICSCKCVHCGTKYESVSKPMDEARELELKPVECQKPAELERRHSFLFNKVQQSGQVETM